MTAPDAVPPQAIELAAEAMFKAAHHQEVSWAIVPESRKDDWRREAEAALAAAYPAIREAIAQEIEADTKDRPGPQLWLTGMIRAARIVRGGDR